MYTSEVVFHDLVADGFDLTWSSVLFLKQLSQNQNGLLPHNFNCIHEEKNHSEFLNCACVVLADFSDIQIIHSRLFRREESFPLPRFYQRLATSLKHSLICLYEISYNFLLWWQSCFRRHVTAVCMAGILKVS